MAPRPRLERCSFPVSVRTHRSAAATRFGSVRFSSCCVTTVYIPDDVRRRRSVQGAELSPGEGGLPLQEVPVGASESERSGAASQVDVAGEQSSSPAEGRAVVQVRRHIPALHTGSRTRPSVSITKTAPLQLCRVPRVITHDFSCVSISHNDRGGT